MKKYFQDGSTYVWLTGVMASLSMLLVAGLFMLIFYYGFSTFWQNDVATIKLNDGSYISGEFKKEGKNYDNETLWNDVTIKFSSILSRYFKTEILLSLINDWESKEFSL